MCCEQWRQLGCQAILEESGPEAKVRHEVPNTSSTCDPSSALEQAKNSTTTVTSLWAVRRLPSAKTR